MSGRYEYANVPEEWKEFAKRELNENPSQVNAHIESLAKWVKSMPHLNCPTDANFLVKFLRVAKYDLAKAQIRLDKFCTNRSYPKEFVKLSKLFKVDDPIVEQFLNMKVVLPLGVDETGEMVVLYRIQPWDPDTLKFSNLLCLFFMVLNIFMMDEAVQIFGIKMIVDLENVSTKAILAMCNFKLVRAGYRIAQDSYPIRIKGQIFYKEPFIFNIVFRILSLFLSDKLKHRTFRLSQDIHKAEKQIPGLVKILPKEYDGEGDTLDNIAERWSKQFIEFYKSDHVFANISVDESKRNTQGLN